MSLLIAAVAGGVLVGLMYRQTHDDRYPPMMNKDPNAGVEVVAGNRVKKQIRYFPQTTYVDNKNLTYWTPIVAVRKPKERKFEYVLNGGVKGILYADGNNPPPLYTQ